METATCRAIPTEKRWLHELDAVVAVSTSIVSCSGPSIRTGIEMPLFAFACESRQVARAVAGSASAAFNAVKRKTVFMPQDLVVFSSYGGNERLVLQPTQTVGFANAVLSAILATTRIVGAVSPLEPFIFEAVFRGRVPRDIRDRMRIGKPAVHCSRWLLEVCYGEESFVCDDSNVSLRKV